jgi:HlyD family secretion protein
METNLRIVQRNMENLMVRAPVSGHLTALNAQIGELKTPGERLGQIDILEGFKARALLDEHYIARIHPRLRGPAMLASGEFDVAITKIYPEVLEGQFAVDLGFTTGEPPGIRRGQTLRVRLELGEPSEALLLATGGFHQRTGGRWAYVLEPSGKSARKRAIQLGRRNIAHYEVLAGLEPGERVITSTYDGFGEAEELRLK